MTKFIKLSAFMLVIASAFYFLPSNTTHAALSEGCTTINGVNLLLNGNLTIPEEITLNAGEIVTVTLTVPPYQLFQDFSIILTPNGGSPTTIIGTATAGTISGVVPFDFTGLVTLSGNFTLLGVSTTCSPPAPAASLNVSVGATEFSMFVVPVGGDTQVHVYDIDSNGNGSFLFAISDEDLAPFIASPPSVNTLIQSVGPASLYALTSGEFQLNYGPDAEGKTYVVIFNGIPATNVYSYVIE
ncbi:MAG: hypothetical protein RLP44_11930 [Aggregatilineales bacterium]